MLRYLQRLTFFDPERLPGVIQYQDIGQPIRQQGIAGLPRLIEQLLLQHRARLVVIDSFKALHDIAGDPVAFRETVFDLARVLATLDATALLVGEYSSAEIPALPEFAVAD